MLRITFPFIRVNSLLKSLFSLCSIYLYICVGMLCVRCVYVCVFIVFSSFLSCAFSKVFIFPSTGSSHLIRSNSKRIIGYNFLPFVVFSSSLCSTLLCVRIVLLGILLSHLLIFCRCRRRCRRRLLVFLLLFDIFPFRIFFTSFLLWLLLHSFVFIIYCCLSASSLTIDAEPISHSKICEYTHSALPYIDAAYDMRRFSHSFKTQ